MKKYFFPIFLLIAAVVLSVLVPQKAGAIFTGVKDNVRELLSILPPIFLLMGLADVWIPRESVVRLMGEGSSFVGIILSVFFGAMAAGPLYAAFPIASMMLRKGASYFNIMVFLGAWSTLKIPMFLFETASLGAAFSVTRWITNVFLLIAIAAFINRVIPEGERKAVAERQSADD